MRIGDKVKRVQGCHNEMQIGDTDIVEAIDYNALSLRCFGIGHHQPFFQVIKEATMSESMKDRIEALTGWDKDCNELLQEIDNKTSEAYRISIPIWSIGINEGIQILTAKGGQPYEVLAKFPFDTQCEKLGAFKYALLWLAEKTGMIDDKKDARRKEIADLKARIERLENEEE